MTACVCRRSTYTPVLGSPKALFTAAAMRAASAWYLAACNTGGRHGKPSHGPPWMVVQDEDMGDFFCLYGQY